MLVTQPPVRGVWNGTTIVDPGHFMLGQDGTAIEVRRPEDALDVYVQPQFFADFPLHGLRKALPFLQAPPRLDASNIQVAGEDGQQQ